MPTAHPIWILTAALAASCPGSLARANVFGDGDPANGVEDDRRGLNSAEAPGSAADTWRRGTGTIVCDGQVRGSATLLDVSGFSDRVNGEFLATAAHVLVNLETGRPFRQCVFVLLALAELPGYRAAIDPDWVRAGPFQTASDRRAPGFGKHDWAFIFLPEIDRPANFARRVVPGAFDAAGEAPDAADHFLVAWDSTQQRMAVSGGCRVRQSGADDIGGGGWAGQLLDDCDSGFGASGGGLIKASDSGTYLVGIRTGSHWSPEAWPPRVFPSGPPPGARWDLRANTNFARGLDQELLDELGRLVREVLGEQAR